MVCSWDTPMMVEQTMVERDGNPSYMFVVENCCWYCVLFHSKTIHDLVRFVLVHTHDCSLLTDVVRGCLIGGIGCDCRSLNDSQRLLLKQLGLW